MSLLDQWASIEAELKKRIGEKSFEFWFVNNHLIKFDKNKLEIGLPSKFRRYVEEKINPHLSEIVKDITGFTPKIETQYSGDYSRQSKNIVPVASGLKRSTHRKANQQQFSLKERYRLDYMVIGKENEVLKHAIDRVLNYPGDIKYNPLLIVGNSGNGKSHSVQGLTHAYLDKGYNSNSMYILGEYFYEKYMSAYRSRNLKHFRDQIRSLSILVVDDLQNLSGKMNIATEFVNLLEEMVFNNRQVILTIDKDLSSYEGKLPTKLIEHLLGGLVIDVQNPLAETRRQIIENKLGDNIKRFSSDAIESLAIDTSCTIRDLESYLQLLLVYSGLNNITVTKDTVDHLLKDLRHYSRPEIDMMDIENAVLAQFDLTSKDLHKKSRLRKFSLPRQICMYLAAELTDYSLNEIGTYFGGRNHSTVHYAIRKIRLERDENEDIRFNADKIIKNLKKSFSRD